MNSNSLGSKANFTQTINFKGSETEYSAEIISQDVTVNCSSGDHLSGSSKVKLKNVVDYNWEMKYYIGQLIACHIDGKVYAYSLRPKGNFGMFRVVNIDSDQRALVKDLKGTIQDISFALTPQVILGCIDEEGNLYIYSVDGIDTKMSCTLLLHVRHPTVDIVTNYRVIWCPYVPTFGEEADTLDDPAKLLCLLNGNKAEVWDLNIVNNKYGAGPLEPPLDNYEGYIEIDERSSHIIDASISPDGTALATASLDGFVKFFQVYMIEPEQPRCLHQWQPHDGKALSCLLFLDNIKTRGISDPKFWKFAITGANHNAELKIWSCESWTCLQTIYFQPNPRSIVSDLFLKLALDMTANYLTMSDINNRILYVLQIKKNEEERVANISTISEFLLPASVISFGIVSVMPTCLRFSSAEDLYEETEDFDEDSNVPAVALKLVVVQPKSLQECTVTFKPEGSLDSNIKSVYGNILESTETEVVCEEEQSPEIPKLNDLQSSVTILIKQKPQPLNLMTPNDFNSPVLNASPNNNIRNSLADISSPTLSSKKDSLVDFQQALKENCTSVGSSPSREVQEILNNTTSFSPEEYFDNLKISQSEENKITANNDFNNDTKSEKNKTEWPNVPIPIMKAIELEMKEEMRRKEEGNANILNSRLSNLENLIKKQNDQIQVLQQEVKSLNGRKSSADFEIRNIFIKELDNVLNKHQAHMNNMFETYTKEQKRKEREQHDHLVTSVSQNLNKTIIDNLNTVTSREIKQVILPPILSVFEKLELQLDVHYSQKLNTIDQLLKTNIAKLFSNKAVSDSLSSSIINVIKPSLENCYKDMIATALIPSWERVCNNMFQQIHNTFTQGTKEYTSSVENYMDRQRKVQDKGKDLINQIQSVSETMRINADKLSSSISVEMQQQINVSFKKMEDKLSDLINDVVTEQVKIGFQTHSAVLEDSVVNAVKSRTVTPSPHDTQAQINSFIAKGNIDLAFQTALSASATASDLSLVLYVCENVNPEEVFGPYQCVLQQHVILSLIQQLGNDLTNHTEIKQKYLQEAILNLDPANPITKEHLPLVLSELIKQLKSFIASNPNNKNLTNMKMLLMATKTLAK